MRARIRSTCTGTTSPLTLYGTNPEHSNGVSFYGFDHAKNVRVLGLKMEDGGNKYLIDLNRNTIGIQKDYLQAQEDYWRGHNHSLDGFQKSWNAEVKSNPRPLSNFSVVPPVDNGDGSQRVVLTALLAKPLEHRKQ